MQRAVLRTVQKFAPAARASAGTNSSVFAAAMAAAAASGAYYCASNPTNTERLYYVVLHVTIMCIDLTRILFLYYLLAATSSTARSLGLTPITI